MNLAFTGRSEAKPCHCEKSQRDAEAILFAHCHSRVGGNPVTCHSERSEEFYLKIMQKTSKIYIAGHTGLVGSSLVRNLQAQGYNNLVYRTIEELDLTNQQATAEFFAQEKPEYVILAAAKVGGI